MSRFTTSLKATLDDEWLTTPFLSLGTVPAGLGTPDVYCLITHDNMPCFRIHLYERTGCPFEEAMIWQSWVIIGFGEFIYFIALEDQSTRSYSLDSYFGHLYQVGEYIVVATGCSLYCFNNSAERVWYTPDLGIDGVVVQKVEHDIIFAEGEWDPPSDVWTPYQLSLQTGKRID
jgi:hypothetical protein